MDRDKSVLSDTLYNTVLSHSFILREANGYPVIAGVQCREFLLHLKLNMLTGIIPRDDEITLPTTALSETADSVSTTKILWK